MALLGLYCIVVCLQAAFDPLPMWNTKLRVEDIDTAVIVIARLLKPFMLWYCVIEVDSLTC